MDAREALRVLEGSGLSLVAAARLALRLGAQGEVERVSVQEGAERFLRDCLTRVERGELRELSYTFYEDGLQGFLRAFGDRVLGDLDEAAVRRYFEALPGARGTVAARFRAVATFLRWAGRQSPPLLAADPLRGYVVSGRRYGEVSVLPVEAVAGAMSAAGRYAPALALVFFGGVRIGEVRGAGKRAMRWGDINLRERIVRVPAECAKTGRARVNEGLPGNLWRWLRVGKAMDPEEDICPARPRQAIAAARSGLPAGLGWEKNVHRHCFGSYHLARWNDPGRLAVLMGHEGAPTMLYRHYRGVVTKAAAEKYFALQPVG